MNEIPENVEKQMQSFFREERRETLEMVKNWKTVKKVGLTLIAILWLFLIGCLVVGFLF